MSNHLKTALICTSALIMPMMMISPSQAGRDNNPFEGTYLGMNANFSKVDGGATYTETNPATSTFDGITSTGKKSGYGVTAFGGIGFNKAGPLYMGLEAALGANGGTGTISDGTTQLSIKAGFSFDLNARIGVTIEDQALVYAIGGFSSVKFTGRGFNDKQGKSLGGYRYGAGVEFAVLENIALRIEYVRTKHSTVTWVQAGDSFQFDPSTQVVKVGLVLHME